MESENASHSVKSRKNKAEEIVENNSVEDLFDTPWCTKMLISQKL